MKTFATFSISFLLLVLTLSGNAATNTWIPIGPEGGDQFELKISPANADELYSLSHFGVHKSTDSGLSWLPIQSTDMTLSKLFAMAIDPNNPNRLFVGSMRVGVWISENGGVSWQSCSSGLPSFSSEEGVYFPVSSLDLDENGDIFAGLAESHFSDVPPAWIYRSTDGCANWSPYDSGIARSGTSVSQKTSTLLSKDSANNLWAMIYGGGVYKKEGPAWIERNGSLPAAGLRSTYLLHDPADSNHMVLGTEDDWLYESFDAGNTWLQVALPGELTSLLVLPLTYGLAIDPNNPQIMFASMEDNQGPQEFPLFQPRSDQSEGQGVFVTNNSGLSWTRSSGSFFRMMANPDGLIDAGTPQERSQTWHYTAGGQAAVMRSNNGANDFVVAMSGIRNELINRLWMSNATDQKRLLAASESGLFLSNDLLGSNWSYLPPESSGLLYTWAFADDYSVPGAILFGRGNPKWNYPEKRGVYRKALDCFSGCPVPEQLLSNVGVWQIVTTPLLPGTIYLGTQENGILVSDNGGQTWSEYNNGLPTPVSITDLLLDEAGNLEFAAVRSHNGDSSIDLSKSWFPTSDETGGVYRFDPGIQEWSLLPGISGAVLDLEKDPISQTIFAATVSGIFKSEDQGDTWESLFSGGIVNDILLDPGYAGYIYAGTYNGVIRSTDGGTQWHDYSQGLLGRVVNSLVIDSNSNVLYAGTGGNSVYRLERDSNPLPVVSVSNIVLDVGIAPIGSPGWDLLIVNNAGEENLVISNVVPNDSRVSIAPDTGFPIQVPPGNNAGIWIGFSPDALGPVSSGFVVNTNDPGTPALNVTILGEGREPAPALPNLMANGSEGPILTSFGDPVTVSLGFDGIGDYQGHELDFWLHWNSPLGTSFWFVAGQGWVETETPTLLSKVVMGQINSVNFDLPTTVSGNGQVRFYVDSNGDGVFDGTWSDLVEYTVSLQPPTVGTAPETLNFGEVPVGLPADLPLRIVNLGEEDLVISSLVVSGTAFTLVNGPALPLTIVPGSDVILMLRMVSSSTEIVSGSLDIASNDPNIPSALVQISGTGIAGSAPVPLVTANGQQGLVQAAYGQNVAISVSLDDGDRNGQETEWWVKAETPVGTFWFVAGKGWVRNDTPQNARPNPIPLFDLAPVTILSFPFPLGDWIFRFVIDDQTDGVYGETWVDEVHVRVIN